MQSIVNKYFDTVLKEDKDKKVGPIFDTNPFM